MTSWAVIPPITPCMGQMSPLALYASCVNRLSSTSSTCKQEYSHFYLYTFTSNVKEEGNQYFSWKYSTLLTCKHIFSELIFLASATNVLASSFENRKTQPGKLLPFSESKKANLKIKLSWPFKLEKHLGEFERNSRRAGCSEGVVYRRVLLRLLLMVGM